MPEKTSEPHGAQVVLSGGNTAPERTTNTNINTSTNEHQHESLHDWPVSGVVSCVCHSVARPFRYTKFKLRSRQHTYRLMLRHIRLRIRMENEEEEKAGRDDYGRQLVDGTLTVQPALCPATMGDNTAPEEPPSTSHSPQREDNSEPVVYCYVCSARATCQLYYSDDEWDFYQCPACSDISMPRRRKPYL